jgi:hypothetical protein
MGYLLRATLLGVLNVQYRRDRHKDHNGDLLALELAIDRKCTCAPAIREYVENHSRAELAILVSATAPAGSDARISTWKPRDCPGGWSAAARIGPIRLQAGPDSP